MKALLCETFGPPETLSIKDIDDPHAVPGEVRIRIAVAGVNFPDGLIIQNQYQIKPDLPFSPGSEVAGIIDEVGADVDGFSVGDRVIAMTIYGGFAELVTVKAAHVVRLPDHVAFDAAASLLMAYGTAYHALEQRGAVQPGETVLVLGAAGGVGLAAVEIAKAMGARVIAAASSAEKLEVARQHGADHLIDYGSSDLREALKAIVGAKGVDVIYDPVGGKLAEQAFRSIARNGRFLVIGFASGDIPAFPLNLPLLKSAAVVGVFWGSFTTHEPEVHRANMAQIFAWMAQDKVRPHVSSSFPFEESAAAIRWVMDRKALGKVVVTIND